MIMLLKILLSIISFLGFCGFIYKKTKVNINFIPILTCSIITIIMLIGGIINLLDYIWILLFATGIILFIYIITKSIILKKDIKPKIKSKTQYWGIAFLCISFVIIGLSLINARYMHVDNFTHWGLILKEMFRINSLPNYNTLVIFRLYPPGTALFIYYLTRIFGSFNESYTLIAQAFLILCGLVPVFAYVKGKNIKVKAGLAIIFCIAALFVNPLYYLQSLKVDTVIATTGVASTIILYYYRKNYKMVLSLVPIILLNCVFTKNSGIIFALINIVLVTIFYFKYNYDKRNKRSFMGIVIAFIILPIIFTTLWRIYAKKAYQTETVDTSYHSMTLKNYTMNLRFKNPKLISEIAINSLKKSIDVKSANVQIIILVNVSVLLMSLIKKKYKDLRYLLFFDIVYITYIIGLIMMYIFSMYNEEAQKLASFIRYQSTIVIYLLITFCAFVLNKIKNTNKADKIIIVSVIVLLALILGNNYTSTDSNPNYTIASREKVEQLISQIEYNKDTKILLYDPENKKVSYVEFLIRYLTSLEVLTIDDTLLKYSTMLELEKFDYIIDITDMKLITLDNDIFKKESIKK